MPPRLEHLGPFSGLLTAARRQRPLWPARQDRRLTPAAIRDLLGFAHDGEPDDVRTDAAWTRDGIAGEELSWSVGYGPRTAAWLLRPEGSAGPLPGVLALHGHDAFKLLGKEKIADGPEGMHPAVGAARETMYEGHAFANQLARRGFTVLVHDAFLWGSRRFAPDVMPASVPPPPEELWIAGEDQSGDPREPRFYNRLAARHEHLIAKYCTSLGTSLAGVVAYEDRIAAALLRARPDVASGPLGAIGLSGGGCRTALLQATCPDIGAAAIVGMMSTHEALLDRHVANHTWMFFPPGLARIGDWPDLAACRAPSPLLVQYNRDDQLFPAAGQQAAHECLTQLYAHAGAPSSYVGEFYDGPHKFDAAMQQSAFEHLQRWLQA
jgi:dienelactone hydrolase